MLMEFLTLVRWMPKVTLTYIALTILYGATINNFGVAIGLVFDFVDYLV